MRHLPVLLSILMTIPLTSTNVSSNYRYKQNVQPPIIKSAVQPKSKVKNDPSLWKVWNTGQVYNHELEYYSPKAVKFTDEGFIITATKGNQGGKNYVSGRVEAKVFPFEYGYVEAKMKLPEGMGMFPALWLRPATGGILPEIDIMENIGRDQGVIVPAYHDMKGGDVFSSYGISNPLGFHTYTLIWRPNLLEWKVDNHIVLETDRNVPKQPMYLVVNLAIGGTWPHNPDAFTKFPQQFVIQRLEVVTDKNDGILGDKIITYKSKK